MKKEYNTPKAEKVEFDYKETVVASRWPWCWGGGQNEQPTAAPTDPQGGTKYNNDPNGQYFKCLATYYYNC